MSLLSSLQSTGTRLLRTYGESVSFSRKVEGAYNVSTGNTATSTDTSFTGYGVSDPFSIYDIDNSTVLSGDIRLYLQSGNVPLVGDVATFNTKAYRVMQVSAVRLQGGDALYELLLRI